MKRPLQTALLLLTAIAAATQPLQASKATREEALAIANAWTVGVVRQDGSWAGSVTPQVVGAEDLKYSGRLVGYYCRVRPKGFIVVSLHKQLAAVKAWSDTSEFDPASDVGPADMIKAGLGRMMDAVEKKTGKKLDDLSDGEIAKVLEIDYSPVWTSLQSGFSGNALQSNYWSGSYLLTCAWSQGDPYNRQCPNLGCTDPGNGTPWPGNTHAWTGCTATCGAQIMKYWCWPPWANSHAMDWPDMPDVLTISSPQVQINTVSEFCYEVGQSVGMDWECDGSHAEVSYLVGAFVYVFHYAGSGTYDSIAHVEQRDQYDPDEWFNMFRDQLNANRPIAYHLPHHAIVCDGWMIENGTDQYHMNYGWGNGFTMWYTLDCLYEGGSEDEEYAIVGIVPAYPLGSAIAGQIDYDQDLPFHYVDRDCVADSAWFTPGQFLQFLPNRVLKCTSTTGGAIRWPASRPNDFKLFSRGDMSKGIFIHGSESGGYGTGSMRINGGGGIAFR